jgi:hypothetical protein
MNHNTARWAALLALGCGLAWLMSGKLVAQVRDPFAPLPKRTAEEWRKLYAFQSVADRLAYEGDQAEKAPPPVLTPEAAKALDNADKTFKGNGFNDVRRQSLKKLHSNEVDDFIKRDGFGLERMPRPSPRYLELAQAPTFPLGRVSYPDSALDRDPPANLPEKGLGLVGESRMPSREGLAALHTQSGVNFLLPDTLGYVRKPQEVAGFDAHKFRFAPTLGGVKLLNDDQEKSTDTNASKERWVLHKLELVGTLKQARPMAYVSAQLPRMEDLKNAPTRELDGFEAAAIRRLQGGEDVATEESLNRIRMVGAVRASAACLDCHNVKRGQLLGAFTYELLRDPPLKKK